MAEKKRRATTFRTSKGTIVNVEYPEVVIPPGLVPGDVTNPTEMRVPLRKEIRSELTVKWYLGDRYTEETSRGGAPFLTRNAQWVEKLENGNYLVVDRSGQQVLEISEDYEVVWEYGTFNSPVELLRPRCAQYLPSQDAYLISDSGNNRILLVDKSTKTVLQALESTGLGAFGEVRARYDSRNNRVWVADPDNHVVVETDWAGVVHSSFGVYGVAGSDATHLDTPVFVEVDHAGGSGWVADNGNHRVTRVSAGAFSTYNFIVPYPLTVHRIHRDQPVTAPISGQLAVGGHRYSLAVERDGFVWWASPLGGTFATLTADQTAIIRRHFQIWEIPLRPTIFTPKWKAQQLNWKLLDDVSLGSGVESDRIPFYCFLHDRTTLRALSDQDATLRIYALDHRLGIWSDDFPATWNQVDTRALAANTLETYPISAPTGVMAADILMGGVDGTVDLWIEQV